MTPNEPTEVMVEAALSAYREFMRRPYAMAGNRAEYDLMLAVLRAAERQRIEDAYRANGWKGRG